MDYRHSIHSSLHCDLCWLPIHNGNEPLKWRASVHTIGHESRAVQRFPRPIDLVLDLPVGNEEGNYKVSLNSADKSLWSAVIVARLSDQKLSLETKVDFSNIPAGRYLLRVESDTGTQISAPVKITKP